jgi:WhiB family redox-sensing transcriptional regulator
MTIPKKQAVGSDRGDYNYMELFSDFALIDKDMSWMDGAACRGLELEAFFPENGNCREAKLVCAKCPKKKRCYDFSIENKIMEGVWGGRSANERRRYLQSVRHPGIV